MNMSKRLIKWIYILQLLFINFHLSIGQHQCIFGSNDSCYMDCHCNTIGHGDNETEATQEPDDCDKTTGECSSGVCGSINGLSWSGPGCQVGNVIYGKQAIIYDYGLYHALYEDKKIIYQNKTQSECDNNVDSYNKIIGASNWVFRFDERLKIDRVYFNFSTKSGIIQQNKTIFPNIYFGLCEDYDDDCNDPIYFEELIHHEHDGYNSMINCSVVALRAIVTYTDRENLVPLCGITMIGHSYINVHNYTCDSGFNGIWCPTCPDGWNPPDCNAQCEVWLLWSQLHENMCKSALPEFKPL